MTMLKIKLDTWHKNCVVVTANQGEVSARFLEITLTDGGDLLNLTNKTVIFYATKPDGNVIFNNCTITNATNGLVTLGLTSQMSVLSGKLNCEIHIIDRDKNTLKIEGLQIRVAPCADSDLAVESTSEFTVLSEAIEQTLQIMDQYSNENIMAKIKSMDGHDSRLDADLLDGKHGSEFAVTNHANPSTTYGVSSATNYGHAMASSTNPIVAGSASIGVKPNLFEFGNTD